MLYFLICGCTEHQQIQLCVHHFRSTALSKPRLLNTVHSKKPHTHVKQTGRTPPKHLPVSIVGCHENPRSRSLFEPTSQVHLHSSNLPNTFCSFCSLFQCLSQTETHNIGVMGKERHNAHPPHPPSSPSLLDKIPKYRVYSWLSLSKSPGALWILFCHLRSRSSVL